MPKKMKKWTGLFMGKRGTRVMDHMKTLSARATTRKAAINKLRAKAGARYRLMEVEKG